MFVTSLHLLIQVLLDAELLTVQVDPIINPCDCTEGFRKNIYIINYYLHLNDM